MPVFPPVRALRGVCLALSGLPFALALAATGRGATPRPVAPAPQRPGLAFSQYLVDLGPVPPSEEVVGYFEFRNVGETAVTVDGFEASCGCVKPYLRPRGFLPGQRGTFTVHVETANQTPGLHEYRVVMKYRDPHPREADLLFRVTLPENEVFVRPRGLAVEQFGKSAATDWNIEIIDRRPQPLAVTRADCTRSGLATIEPDRTELDAQGHTHIHLRATIAGDLPKGRYDALIRIFTDDPEYRVLRVPLRVQASDQRALFDPQVHPAGATAEDAGRNATFERGHSE